MIREYLENMHHACHHGHISRFEWRCQLVLHKQALRQRDTPPLPVEPVIHVPPGPGQSTRLRLVN